MYSLSITVRLLTLWEEGVMEEWLENFVMCEELLCEMMNEIGKPREQVPPMAVRKYTPEKIENHEKPETGPPPACVIGKKEERFTRFQS